MLGCIIRHANAYIFFCFMWNKEEHKTGKLKVLTVKGNAVVRNRLAYYESKKSNGGARGVCIHPPAWQHAYGRWQARDYLITPRPQHILHCRLGPSARVQLYFCVAQGAQRIPQSRDVLHPKPYLNLWQLKACANSEIMRRD